MFITKKLVYQQDGLFLNLLLKIVSNNSNFTTMKTLFFLLCSILGVYSLNAQVIANAGPDKHSCQYDPNADLILIGGTPTAQSGTPPYTYEWSIEPIVAGGGCSYIILQAGDILDNIEGSNPYIIDRFAAPSIEFYLKVTDANGAVDYDTTVITFSNFVQSQTFYTYTINLGDSVLLNQEINITGGVPPLNYNWQPEAGLMFNHFETAFWAKPTQTTFYHVEITDAMGCQATGFPMYNVIVNGTGILESEAETPFTIFPNPVHNSLNIWNNSHENILRTTLFDLQGRLIQEFESNSSPIDLTPLTPGLYLIRIETSSNGYVYKLLKE